MSGEVWRTRGGRVEKYGGREGRAMEWWSGGVVEWLSGEVVEWLSGGVAEG